MSKGKLESYMSASTIDTDLCSEFSYDDIASSDDDDEPVIKNLCSIMGALETSSHSRSGRSIIKKPTPENCDAAKTCVSRNRTKTRSTRRVPKGRRVRPETNI